MNPVRRTTLATLIGGVAAATSFSAFAHRGRGGAHGSMDIERMLKHLYVEIEATEEQKQRLDPIVRQAVQDLAPVRRSLHEARGQAIGLLAQDQVDAGALEALRARQIQLADQASRSVTRALVEAAEVLNPAQRKRLAAHLANRRRWGHA